MCPPGESVRAGDVSCWGGGGHSLLIEALSGEPGLHLSRGREVVQGGRRVRGARDHRGTDRLFPPSQPLQKLIVYYQDCKDTHNFIHMQYTHHCHISPLWNLFFLLKNDTYYICILHMTSVTSVTFFPALWARCWAYSSGTGRIRAGWRKWEVVSWRGKCKLWKDRGEMKTLKWIRNKCFRHYTVGVVLCVYSYPWVSVDQWVVPPRVVQSRQRLQDVVGNESYLVEAIPTFPPSLRRLYYLKRGGLTDQLRFVAYSKNIYYI